MRPRSRKIAVTVVCLLNLQWLISQITLQNLMFLRERMTEDFVQESESLLFLTALLLSVHRRRGNFRHIRKKAWAWPRPQNWFDVMLASPRLNVLWKPNFRMERETFDELCRILSDKTHDFEIFLLSGFLDRLKNCLGRLSLPTLRQKSHFCDLALHTCHFHKVDLRYY